MIKRNRFITVILTLIVASATHFALAQDSIKTFVPILNYTADLVVNTHGGIKTGALFLGYAELGVKINPWKNGQFNLTIAATHGDDPSEKLVGDWQTINNNTAGNYIFALYAWYSHTIGRVTLKAGLQDANYSYSTCETSGNMLNTSFGCNQVLLSAGNIPIMPNTSLGFNVDWRVSDSFSWQTGIFNGEFIPFEDNNKFNLKHKLSSSRGYVILSEAQLAPASGLVVKAGALYHTGHKDDGYYASCEKSFRLRGERFISPFVTAGYAPKGSEEALTNITGGAKLTSLFSNSGADALTAGLAAAHFNGRKWETTIELNYHYTLNDHFFVSPDVQWVINPGFDLNLENALVCSLRVGYEL